ncbi:MAG: ShlB/FhaC/HecB family hemolysin secretion/activation protein [Cyanobacteria bacterium J06635_15]
MSLISLYAWRPAIAQPSSDPPPDPVEETLPSPEDPLPTPEPPPPEPPQIFIPDDATPPVDPEPADPVLESTNFTVERIHVLGSTVLQNEITDLVNNFLTEATPLIEQPNAPIQRYEVTLAELLDLRSQITALYIEKGYITSGAFLPNNQDLSSGVVYIQVVEGTLETIQINGLNHLREYYVRDRINIAISAPLNVRQLEEGLRLLQIDPLLDRVNAELTAGSGPGRNILVLDLTEANPYFINLAVSNNRSTSIGSSQISPTIANQNVLGLGDRFSVRYDYTEGLDLYSLGYSVPVNALDGTLSAQFERGESRIVDPRFLDAGIRSETQTLSFNFRQPLTRSLSSEVALGLGFDLRESRSFILENIPFSFSLGPEDGVSRVSAIRFSQEWLNRDIDTVLAARSQFSLGIGAFGATVNDTGTDGRFFSWIGQFQWVQQFAPGTLLLARINTQLTPDSLLPLERFSLGGVSTVRGYAQNELVTDNAVTSSIEVRFPISDDPNTLQLAPFIDFGTGWNNRTPNPEVSTLLGIGAGLQWRPASGVNLRLDYGIPLISTSSNGTSLQENGFYFSINLQPLEPFE